MVVASRWPMCMGNIFGVFMTRCIDGFRGYALHMPPYAVADPGFPTGGALTSNMGAFR